MNKNFRPLQSMLNQQINEQNLRNMQSIQNLEKSFETDNIFTDKFFNEN